MAVQDYKINYKSDFVLNINGDAGWAVPFCIKFWTGMPSQAYFVGFDGVKYVNCRVGDTPTQLLVMFDDHHLPIGKLKMQIAYHTTIEEFPGSVFDEVTNARDVIVTIDGTDYQVLLDFTGEDAPELEFDLPAYANEAERIQNELQRQQNEADRIAAELQREQATAAAVQGAENVNAQLNGTTLTVTNRLGVSTSVNTKGEQGEQGPVGPEGPQGEQGVSIVSFLPKSETSTTLIYTITYSNGYTQDVAIPKGPKGDTGATGPTGPQGPQGVSVIGFTQTGETATNTMYNLVFSDGRTQSVAIPKGVKGDKGDKGDDGNPGSQGAQGPKGDTVTATDYTLYNVQGSDSQGAMSQDATTKAISAQTGYYTCGTAAGTPEKVVTVESGNLYKRTLGGHFKVKMTNANTAASGVTLQIGSETAAALWYNGVAASDTNTWDAGEVISVYFDGTYYQASNAQGSGGKAEKIKYDNSQSGLAANNVQGALDEVAEEVTVFGDNLIDMSVMGVDKYPTNSTYLTATKDTENNGVVFNVVSHNNSSPFGRIYQMHLVAGKTYRLSFEYLNTAYKTSPGFRNSSNTFIASDISSVMMPVNNEYKVWECVFVAPANAYYLGFSGLTKGSANTSLTIKNFSCVEISSLKESIAELDDKIEDVREENVIEEQVTLPEPTTYGITNAGAWNMDSSYSHFQIPIEKGRKYKIVGNALYNTRVWWCTGVSTPVSGGSIPLCAGTSVIVVSPNEEIELVAPETANYMYTDAGSNSSGNVGSPQSVTLYTDFEELNKQVGNIKDSVETIGEEVFEGINIMSDVINIPYAGAQAIKAADGLTATVEDFGHSNYIPTNGASAIYLYAPTMFSSIYGIAFYYKESQSSYISGNIFSYPKTGGSIWVKFDVPFGANFFRTTLRDGTTGQYRIVAPTENLMDIFKDAAASVIGTQIMRSATPISGKNYIYAFGINQMSIIDSKAYVPYNASETSVNADAVGAPSESCLSIVDLFDFSVETIYPVNGTKQYANGTDASNAILGYATSCPTPQGNIGYFGLMRFNNYNPYYCHSILDVSSIPSLEPVDGKKHPVKNWTSCLLSYNGNTVDFSLNNYRQMLVDMGYMSTYIAGSTNDYVDNINIHYNKEESIYYAVLCGAAATNSQSLPLVLMQSTDMATWSPKAYLGKTVDAGEIAAIYKDGIAYVVYRRMSQNGIWYVVYDVTNDTELSSGQFPVSKELLSKPDCFEFDDNVYMACNIDPFAYGELLYYSNYSHDSRQEIAIYKVVNGVPKFFRRVNNPTGLNYYSFMETPPMYATESSTTPMYAQGAIYVAFSEDRRHLYRRQFAQVSFADATALFADNGRII